MTDFSTGKSALLRISAPYTARGQRFWEGLSKREQGLIRALASLIALLALWSAVSTLFWSPYLAKKEALESLKSDMLQVQSLTEEIGRTRALLASQTRRLSREERGFSLIAYLEDEAGHAHIRSLITQMTPRTLAPEGPYKIRMVSIRIDSVDLPHAVFFLARLERSPHFIRITRISMKRRFNNHGQLDVQLDVEAIQPS